MLNSTDCSKFRFNRRLIRQAVCICFLTATPFQAWAQDVSPAHLQSGKYRALESWRNRIVTHSSVSGAHDTLAGYAAKCDAATGIHVPGFTCGNGSSRPDKGRNRRGLCQGRVATIQMCSMELAIRAAVFRCCQAGQRMLSRSRTAGRTESRSRAMCTTTLP